MVLPLGQYNGLKAVLVEQAIWLLTLPILLIVTILLFLEPGKEHVNTLNSNLVPYGHMQGEVLLLEHLFNTWPT
jgi:hypothetical protein